MKKVIAVLLAIVMCFSFVACKSQAEKDLETARAVADAASENLARVEAEQAAMDDLISEYEYLQSLIPTLPDGSAEKEAAIERNNEIARYLLDEYPELSQYVTVE